MDTSTTAGGDKQQKHVADDEGRDEEGGKGEENGDEGGGQATATMVKKRARAARVMVTRVVGDEEGDVEDEVCFKRSGVTGTLRVNKASFELDAQLGFLLGAFKDKIEAEIVKNLDQLLAAPAKPAVKKKKP